MPDLSVRHVAHPVVDHAHRLPGVRVSKVHELHFGVIEFPECSVVGWGNLQAFLDKDAISGAHLLVVVLVVEDVGDFLVGVVDVDVGHVLKMEDLPQLDGRGRGGGGAHEEHGEDGVDAERGVDQVVVVVHGPEELLVQIEGELEVSSRKLLSVVRRLYTLNG